MKWSLYLGRYAGIRVFVHWTFWILVVWIFVMYFRMGDGTLDGLRGVGFVLALFACVVLHEFGHALTARRFDIDTRDITLLPIGGVARLEQMPEKPMQELLVAIMGPAVNVVIAFVLYAWLAGTGGLPDEAALEAIRQSEETVLPTGMFLFNLMVVNVILVVFNMIPAFPMDGGRVLRAVLSFGMTRSRATAIAATLGQLLAILFVFAGFFTSFWLVFIGIFIFLGAGGEASYEQTRGQLADFHVRDVLMTKYTILPTTDTVGDAARMLLAGQEQEFLVGSKESVEGILTRKSIIRGLSESGSDAPISKVMETDFPVLRTDMALTDVYRLMTTGGHTVGPVYDAQDQLAGIVDMENIKELIMIRKADPDAEVPS